jgi:hypothetical protein
VDFQIPIYKYQQAVSKINEEMLLSSIGEVAVSGSNDATASYMHQGGELHRQYEAMNDEQRKGFDAALIALTGWCYSSIVDTAVSRLGG